MYQSRLHFNFNPKSCIISYHFLITLMKIKKERYQTKWWTRKKNILILNSDCKRNTEKHFLDFKKNIESFAWAFIIQWIIKLSFLDNFRFCYILAFLVVNERKRKKLSIFKKLFFSSVYNFEVFMKI